MPDKNFQLALIQTGLHWQNKAANINAFNELISNIQNADLILLPEMFTTGFSMEPQGLADTPEGDTLVWLQEKAGQADAAISGSLIVCDKGKYYNRLYFVFPDGKYKTYNKRHLFTLAGEEKVYSSGKEKLILNFRGWKINPQVCYDLRFPVWCRNTTDFDLQFFVANWPARRSAAWKALLKARAIENMCYVAGLNRIGDDGNGVYHSGDSGVYNALGKKVSHTQAGETSCETVSLSAEDLNKARKKFAFLKDRDAFELKT